MPNCRLSSTSCELTGPPAARALPSLAGHLPAEIVARDCGFGAAAGPRSARSVPLGNWGRFEPAGSARPLVVTREPGPVCQAPSEDLAAVRRLGQPIRAFVGTGRRLVASSVRGLRSNEPIVAERITCPHRGAYSDGGYGPGGRRGVCACRVARRCEPAWPWRRVARL